MNTKFIFSARAGATKVAAKKIQSKIRMGERVSDRLPTCNQRGFPHTVRPFMSEQKQDVNRRDFIAAGSSLAAMAAMMQAFEARAQESGGESTARRTDDSTPPIKMGLIGYGPHGREIARNLAQLPSAPLVAISDTYGPMLRRSKREHPKAKGYAKYQDLLTDKNVEGVIIATAPIGRKR